MSASGTFDAVVIGSGLGGLLTANILAAEGMNVGILEQHHHPGGCLQTFRRKGVVFDTGVHYFGGYDDGGPLRRYWNYFGIPEKLETERLDPDGFDIIGFPEGDFPIGMGFGNFVEQLHPHFPAEKETLVRFVSALQEIATSFPLYNLEPPANHSEEKYRHASADIFFTSFNQIPNPESRIPLSAILSGNNLLYAGDPARTTLHAAAIISHSFISGAWRTVGGSDRIADILVEKLNASGGSVFLQQRVTAIQFDGELFSVVTEDNSVFRSRKVIAAIHPSTALNMMDPSLFRPAFLTRIHSLRNTVSSFAVHAILKKGSFPYRRSNYYFHATREVWCGAASGVWPQHYLLQTPAPAQDDGSAESLVILAPMPFAMTASWENTGTGNRGDDYGRFREEMAGRLLSLAEQRFPGLRDAIAFMEVSTPLTWRDYTGIPDGSMYGIEHDYRQPMLTSVLPRTKVPGFFFTGQNVNLHGMLGVTIAAVMTCGEIVGLPYLIQKIRRHA